MPNGESEIENLEDSEDEENSSIAFTHGAAVISELLSNPGFKSGLIDVIDRNLPEFPDRASLVDARDRLTEFLGSADASLLVLTFLNMRGDPVIELGEDGIVEILGDSSGSTLPFLMEMRSRFTAKAIRLWDVWDKEPTDWRYVNTDVRYSETQQRVIIDIDIDKNDFTTDHFSFSPDSLLDLIGFILKRLAASELGGYSAGAVENFFGATGAFAASLEANGDAEREPEGDESESALVPTSK